MSDRKIIQINHLKEENGSATIIALCDDGSIWLWNHYHFWKKLQDIPQDNGETNNA